MTPGCGIRAFAVGLAAAPALGLRARRLSGCGCALAGLAAGALGAKEVTLTAECKLTKNFALHPDLFSRFRFQKLDWGDAEMIVATMPPFDLVLGSDMYRIVGFHREVAPGTTALMVTPNWVQENKKKRKERFEEPRRAKGLEIFDISDISPAEEIIDSQIDRGGPIRVLEIRRAAAKL